MPRPKLHRTDSANLAFIELTNELTAFLAILNGEQDAFYSQYNKIDSIPNAVVAYVDDIAVGCGAFRVVDETTIEVKRMFVVSSARAGGVGKAILEELESWAAELGYETAILETSKRLDSAVRLYVRSGFSVIPNYGPYVGVEDSVCMAKRLAPSACP